MDNDQRIGMVSILVMRQCDRCRQSQFCLTHLGEHVEWFKTTPKSGALYDSSGWGEWGVVWPSERPRGKLRSAVMIRFVQWFDLVYYLQCDETTDDCGKHDVACDESGDRGSPGMIDGMMNFHVSQPDVTIMINAISALYLLTRTHDSLGHSDSPLGCRLFFDVQL